MNLPDLLGLAGAIIAGIAYLPQIVHLVREKCSAGISRSAYMLWVLSASLITASALYAGSMAFIVLGFVQLSATGTVLAFSTRYRGSVCGFHAAPPARR